MNDNPDTTPETESTPSGSESGFARMRATLAVPYLPAFFASNFVNFLCGMVAMLAMQWLVTGLTDSRLLISMVAFVQGGTVFLFSPLGGYVADRVAKRSLLLSGRICLGVLMAGMGALVHMDVIEIYHVLIGSVVGGLVMALTQPATQTYVMDLVGRDRLENAIALNATSSGVAQVLGPAAGGALLAAFGIAMTFYGAAIGMTAAASLLLAIPVAGRLAASEPKPRFNEMGEGFSYVWKDRGLRWVMVVCGMALFNGAVNPMRPVFARFVLDVGEVGLGGMASASGAGTILAAIALASLGRFKHVGLWITSSMLVFGIGVLLYSLAFSYEYILAVEFLLGASGQIWNVTVIAGLQLVVPAHLRGRVVALIFMVAQLGFIGVPIVGALADRVGDQIALGVFGALPSVITATILLVRFKAISQVGEEGRS